MYRHRLHTPSTSTLAVFLPALLLQHNSEMFSIGELEQFRNWCKPNPDFLWRLVEPRNYMRLSVNKVAHNCSRPGLRRRKSGERQAFSWFSPKENHTSRSLSDHSNCETALSLGKVFLQRFPIVRVPPRL